MKVGLKITRYHWRAVQGNASAYEEGLEAASAGKGLEACPYPKGTRKCAAWIMGWLGA